MSNTVDRQNSTLGNASVRRAQRKLPKLSEEQILEFKEAFKLFDTDNGGSIDVDELKDALESLGQVVTEDSVQALVDEVDEDGSGEIEFDEFLVLMSRQILNSDVTYDCEKAFDIWCVLFYVFVFFKCIVFDAADLCLTCSWTLCSSHFYKTQFDTNLLFLFLPSNIYHC